MTVFGHFYLDKEKDIIVDLFMEGETLSYVLRTPNHATGNLITNLARLCGLSLSFDADGLKIVRGQIPCYIDDSNRAVYIMRLGDTKVANIYPDGTIERKASIPAIAKTLMSQTKSYNLGTWQTLVKTYIPRDYKFRTDLHTHMNANLDPDILIALGIHHQIRYPLYYIRKLKLRCTPVQEELLIKRREAAAKRFKDSPLKGKYLTRRINDNTFINFADFILADPENTAYNLPKIRASLSILKDGQAVFSNLEKVYLYRYVFTKGQAAEDPVDLASYPDVPDREIAEALAKMQADRKNPNYADFSLLQDKLLWIARGCQKRGISYMEISDTGLVKPDMAASLLGQIHASMPEKMIPCATTSRYLSYGVSCVQGTDGGAIYGTDSIDEQLALERMLNLSYDAMLVMRKAEDRVLTSSMENFYLKQASFAKLCGSCDPEVLLGDRIQKEPVPDKTLMIGRGRLESLESLGDQVREMPLDKVPVILLGGSFNTDRRQTRMQEWAMDLLRRITDKANSDKVFL